MGFFVALIGESARGGTSDMARRRLHPSMIYEFFGMAAERGVGTGKATSVWIINRK